MRRRMLVLLAVLCLGVCRVGWAASYTMAELMQGNVVPEERRLKELDEGWKRIALGPAMPSFSDGGMFLLMLMYAHGGRSPLSGATCYTRGDSVSCGDEKFLVVYQRPADVYTTEEAELALRLSGVEGREEMEEIFGRKRPAAIKLADADTVLSLALLNLQTTKIIRAVTPFELAAEVPSPALRAKVARMQSLANLRRLAMAVMMYAQDHEEMLPAGIADLPIRRQLLVPETNEEYRYNISLNGVALGEIKFPAKTVLLYEPAAAPDGLRAVAFVDGHTDLVNETEWQEYAKVYKIE